MRKIFSLIEIQTKVCLCFEITKLNSFFNEWSFYIISEKKEERRKKYCIHAIAFMSNEFFMVIIEARKFACGRSDDFAFPPTDMQDLSLLQILDRPNEHLSSVWALMPPLSPKPPPLPNLPQSLLEDDNKEGKGSRFAKFMAERQELLKKSIQLGKMERRSNEIIPSKLWTSKQFSCTV